jgi:hypothetical protein
MDSGVSASDLAETRDAETHIQTKSDVASGQLQTSGQILTFEPGLYAVDIRGKGRRAQGNAFSLPCARLDPIQSGPGRATVSTLSEGGWLAFTDQTMFLQVVDSPVDVLLTTYRGAGAPGAPELTIKAIRGVVAADASVDEDGLLRTNSAGANQGVAAPLTLMAHVEKIGDVCVGLGEWVSAPPESSIEGIRIETQGHLAVAKLEYQAIYAEGWQTPWFRAGDYCGSRGMSLPFRGFRVRLVGDAAADFNCSYWGRFADGIEVGPVFDGMACESLGQTLCSLRVQVTERAATLAAPPSAARAAESRRGSRARNAKGAMTVVEAGPSPRSSSTQSGKRGRSKSA